MVKRKVSKTKKTAPKAATGHSPSVEDGAKCKVIGGTHKGKEGIVRDLNTSKTGQLTITVVQQNGERFKTLARNVSVD